MPTKRRRRVRPLVRQEPAPEVRHFLLTGRRARWSGAKKLPGIQLMGSRRRCGSLWRDGRDSLLAAWLVERPGTRPWAWWEFDAPRATEVPERFRGGPWVDLFIEPRRQLQGSSVPRWAVVAFVPRFSFWHSRSRRHRGRSL